MASHYHVQICKPGQRNAEETAKEFPSTTIEALREILRKEHDFNDAIIERVVEYELGYRSTRALNS
jgi:hypothetical protein